MAIVLPPSSGTGQFAANAVKCIRFARKGCTNRPFFHIVVSEKKSGQLDTPIEQLGSYDPMPNSNNEKLVSINFERVKHWIGSGAEVSGPIRELLGLAGFYPIHPRCYMEAWRKRRDRANEMLKNEQQAKEDTLTQSNNQ